MSNKETLKRAAAQAEAGELDEAWRLVDGILAKNPNDLAAITLATQINRKARRSTTAYQWAKAGIREGPNNAAAWLNLGCACADLYQREEAEYAYERAATLMAKDGTPKQRALLLTNRAAMHLDYAEWAISERYSREALTIEPASMKCRGNLGIALLAQRQWSEGWKYYSAITHEHRHRFQYGEAGMSWNGKKANRVVFNGEQGLGDEICFASMLPDAIPLVKHAVIDCDKRLQGLFARSFPTAKVYGTRWQKELDWAKEDQQIDASTSFGELGQYFRLCDEDFPGTSYLIADPDRVRMWRALCPSRPMIGIAWSGGVPWTGSQFRRRELNDLLPIFRAVPDALWISLQYKDAREELVAFRASHPEIDIRQFSYATLTDDYDDTAGMVAACDAIVSVPTAVVHLAAGLGIPCVAMKAPASCWKFASRLFLGNSTHLIENDGDWSKTIEATVYTLETLTNAQSIPRIRSSSATGIHGAPSFDHSPCERTGVDNAAGALAVAH